MYYCWGDIAQQVDVDLGSIPGSSVWSLSMLRDWSLSTEPGENPEYCLMEGSVWVLVFWLCVIYMPCLFLTSSVFPYDSVLSDIFEISAAESTEESSRSVNCTCSVGEKWAVCLATAKSNMLPVDFFFPSVFLMKIKIFGLQKLASTAEWLV